MSRCRAAILLVLALSVAPCGAAHAQDADKASVEVIAKGRESAVTAYSEEARAVADRAQATIRKGAVNPDLVEIERDSQSFVADSLPEGALQSRERFADEPSSFLVFASTSMPEPDLLALLEVASDQANVHVIFRGVPESGGLDGFMEYLTRLTKGHSINPTLTIDPPQWQARAIKVAPTIVALEHGVEIGRATGTANPAWLREQLITRKGDLGAYGKIYEPAERDMVEVLREAVAKIDTEKLRRDAENSFWMQQPRIDLPVVQEARVLRVDPSVEISRDVVVPDGTVLAKKGDRINPLLAVAFDQRLIVIDGSDPKQRALAKQLAADAPSKVVVISTRGPSDDDSAETWVKWQTDVEQRMYLLNPRIQASLHIERVPTMIEADGAVLVVNELMVPKGGL